MPAVNVWAALERHVRAQSALPAQDAAELPGPPWARRACLRAGFAAVVVPADVPGAAPWPEPSVRKAASPAAADTCSPAEVPWAVLHHDSLPMDWPENQGHRRSSPAHCGEAERWPCSRAAMCCAPSLAAVRHDSPPLDWQVDGERPTNPPAHGREGER